MDKGDAVELTGRQRLADGLWIDGLTPVELEGFGVLAATLGDVVPLVGERAVHAIKHTLTADITQGTFHDTPS